MKKLTKIMAVIFTLTLGTTSLAGCSQADDEKSKAKPSTDSVSVESSTEEVSVENSAESSADTSSAESSVESKVDESSVESSVESKVDESSAESFVESKVDESLVENSVESSIDELSIESSIESKIDESTESESSSQDNTSSKEEKKVSFDEVIRYGRIKYDIEIKEPGTGETIPLIEGLLIAIVSFNDETYSIYVGGTAVEVDASAIEVFPTDYEPDFKLRIWFGFDKEKLGLV